jgi:hypothetical protein
MQPTSPKTQRTANLQLTVKQAAKLMNVSERSI